MEAGVPGEVVAYPVEEEVGQELAQTLPQPMEEMIVWDLSVRPVTPKTVGESIFSTYDPVFVQDACDEESFGTIFRSLRTTHPKPWSRHQNQSYSPFLTIKQVS